MAGHYGHCAERLRAELAAAIPREDLRGLHRRLPFRHFTVAVRQFAILGLCTWALTVSAHPAVVVPLVLVQGWTVFNFTVLLHEVVHHLVFQRPHSRAERLLGLLYATPSGLS